MRRRAPPLPVLQHFLFVPFSSSSSSSPSLLRTNTTTEGHVSLPTRSDPSGRSGGWRWQPRRGAGQASQEVPDRVAQQQISQSQGCWEECRCQRFADEAAPNAKFDFSIFFYLHVREGQDMDHIHKYPSQYSDFLIGT
ncbi:uncharacterized protein [Triticum aestivum]|uniref:uncharacterized protein n=1 Tax=Triticum aestivum TaxID=4565 RepID=UPI001D0080BE|nr:uncharacterized protein LOC123167108 [Triticum aestivum]